MLGGGESGVGAARLAQAHGFEVFVSDLGTIKPAYVTILENLQIPFESNQHTESKILNANLVIKSPGIPDHIPLIKKLRELDIEVISEIEFAFRYAKGEIIAITGSNGKTTTTSLTYHLLKAGNCKVLLGGNIGRSFASLVLEAHQDQFFLLELSSFQLDGIKTFKPDIAAILNISPDHLDRYHYDIKEYTASKFRIIMNMDASGKFLYHPDNDYMNDFLAGKNITPALYPISVPKLTDRKINVSGHQFNLHNPALRGLHNAHNAAFAIRIAQFYQIPAETIQKALDDFQNVPHRMEAVATINGVEYINDSKATNVDAVYYALDAQEKPIVWIVGGQDKGNEYEELNDLVRAKVKQIICLGIDNHKITQQFLTFSIPIAETQSMTRALALAQESAESGDVVLLSPACASFDLFKNYEDRGDQFREEVLRLKEKESETDQAN